MKENDCLGARRRHYTPDGKRTALLCEFGGLSR
jgi:hypothetical protein